MMLVLSLTALSQNHGTFIVCCFIFIQIKTITMKTVSYVGAPLSACCLAQSPQSTDSLMASDQQPSVIQHMFLPQFSPVHVNWNSSRIINLPTFCRSGSLRRKHKVSKVRTQPRQQNT